MDRLARSAIDQLGGSCPVLVARFEPKRHSNSVFGSLRDAESEPDITVRRRVPEGPESLHMIGRTSRLLILNPGPGGAEVSTVGPGT